MARNAARRMGWRKRSDGASVKGQRDVQQVAHRKDATSQEMLTLIDGPDRNNLPVQPVAQRQAVESVREREAPAHGGAQIVSTKLF